MGAYTFYTIEYSDKTKLINEYTKCKFGWDLDSDFLQDPAGIKWSEYYEELLKVSKKFPDVLITVYGDSHEDDEDKWVQYFYNGMKTLILPAKIKISYTKFDIGDLTDDNDNKRYKGKH